MQRLSTRAKERIETKGTNTEDIGGTIIDNRKRNDTKNALNIDKSTIIRSDSNSNRPHRYTTRSRTLDRG